MDETWHNELSEFIAIPSVSADPAHREDVKRAGEWVCDFIRRIGGTAELTPFGEKELALGEIRRPRTPTTRRRFSCYGHFDVQPPAPLDLWESDPFELTIKDDWAYARGITDDKGQLFILLKAAQRLVEANALPVNLRFACDGEEEIGGTTIVDWIAHDDRGADAGDHLRRRHGPYRRPGVRPCDARSHRVRPEGATGERDLHSGMYGGAALNAIHVLMRCLRRGARRRERTAARAAAPGDRGADGGGARELGGAAARRGRAASPGRAPARPGRGGGVQHPHARRAVRRRERDPRRQARAPEHDALGPRGRRVSRSGSRRASRST